MNGRLRLILCGACVAIGVLHAPLSTHVLAEDLAGTYDFVVRAERGPATDARVATAREQGRTEVDVDSHDAEEAHGSWNDARRTAARR